MPITLHRILCCTFCLTLAGLASCSQGQPPPAPHAHAPASVQAELESDAESPRLQDLNNADEPVFFKKTGFIESDLIHESSGIAISFHQPNAFWTINDSGGAASLYCLTNQGKLLAIVELVGASNRDWESLSRFSIPEGQFLVVGEIGDNLSRHEKCYIYILPEAKFERKQAPVKLKATPIAIEFVYEDGPRDCEAIAVDPMTNDLWLFEKIMQLNFRHKPGVYRIKADEWLPKVTATRQRQQTNSQTRGKPPELSGRLTALRHCDLGHRFVTGGDFSPDGTQLVIRTYSHAILYQREAEQTWEDVIKSARPTLIPLPLQRQGEAIAFTADSKSVLVTSEHLRQSIWMVDIAGYLKYRKK